VDQVVAAGECSAETAGLTQIAEDGFGVEASE
jgi:hypothetical protein